MVRPGSAGPDDVRDDDATRPETSSPALSGPAPVIDLGEDAVPVRPAKPLGPRRLARLQRELAERSRELEEAGGDPADPELLEKQRRFAQLAEQAANTQPADGGAVREPTAEPVRPEDADPAPWHPQPGSAEPAEHITVVFPEAGSPDGPDGHVAHDPVHVDPALFSHRLSPEELAALTHIEILAPGDPEHPEQHGSHAVPPGREDPGGAVEQPAAPVPPDPAARAEPDPPAVPVPATAAEGLELLEPAEYRRRAGRTWLVLLLLAVLAALVVVLVLFVL